MGHMTDLIGWFKHRVKIRNIFIGSGPDELYVDHLRSGRILERAQAWVYGSRKQTTRVISFYQFTFQPIAYLNYVLCHIIFPGLDLLLSNHLYLLTNIMQIHAIQVLLWVDATQCSRRLVQEKTNHQPWCDNLHRWVEDGKGRSQRMDRLLPKHFGQFKQFY